MLVEKRKVIQFSAVGDERSPDRLYALCDDGSMWFRRMANDYHSKLAGTGWSMVPEVPGRTIEGEPLLPSGNVGADSGPSESNGPGNPGTVE